ncbi:hypothetical protein [Pseudomonas juntendi]|uniref:hypothetical protein n=1 Tax=Pseudomonas juntendi TaxID=2666183 RepID=UPI001B82229D|nr:hypothetical protein [Pseudomonas juntendi]MBR7522405.1 hypothetical protein [Pseudomonas juntendi]
MSTKLRKIAQQVSLGARQLYEDNAFVERVEPTLEETQEKEAEPENNSVSESTDLKKDSYKSFAGIGDDIPDYLEEAVNHAPKTPTEIEREKKFSEILEELIRGQGYNFKASPGLYKALEGHQRVATFKENGSMTYHKPDIDGPHMQEYIKLLCEQRFAHQTKPVNLTINEKLIQNEDTRIAFFRNSISTLVDNGVDIERVRITNKAYRYLLDEFKQNAVELELGNHDAESKAHSKVRKEPELDMPSKVSRVDKKAANDGDAPGELLISNGPDPEVVNKPEPVKPEPVKPGKVTAVEDLAPFEPIKASEPSVEKIEIKEKELTSDATSEVKNQTESATFMEKPIKDPFEVSRKEDGFYQAIDEKAFNVDDLLNEDVSFADVFPQITKDDPLFAPDFHAPKPEPAKEKAAVEKCALVQNSKKLEEMFKNEDINSEIKKKHRSLIKP